MLEKTIKYFCRNTNIHGFGYIVQQSGHRIEKIFWSLSILISFILTGILIHKLVIESQKNPTIIYTDQSVVNVEELNFPAVSICPGLLTKSRCETIIDYDKMKLDLIDQPNITRYSLDDLKLLQIASLI